MMKEGRGGGTDSFGILLCKSLASNLLNSFSESISRHSRGREFQAKTYRNTNNFQLPMIT